MSTGWLLRGRCFALARWRTGVSICRLLVLFGGFASCAPHAVEPASPILHLRTGTVAVTVDGVTRTGALELPYHWDRLHDWRAGEARFEVPFSLPSPPAEPWGLFISRVGSTFDVTLNGDLLQTYGDPTRGNGADYAKAPVYVPIPAHLLEAGVNSLQIRIRADVHRQAGLSPLVLGPARQVRSAYFEPTYAWRFTGSVLLAAFSIVVGVTALALWLTQVGAPADRRRDNLYLWAALAGLCWALRVADGAIRAPFLPWVEWGTLMMACNSGWAGAAVMFCQHLAGLHDRPGMQWLHRAAAFVFTMPVIGSWLALSRAEPHWLTGWLALEMLAVTAYVIFFIGVTVRRPNPARVLLASIAVLTMAMAARDWFVVRMEAVYGEDTWVRYTSVLFGIALLAIVLERFREASTQVRCLLRTLATRVADRERELAAAYVQLEAIAREQARTQERERILRDMHDGVGLRITAAIHQVQSGQASEKEVLSTLCDSLDQLKLSIDAIHLPSGDVEALLAGLRYRLGPRLAAANLVFEWGVDELPPLPRFDGDAMRHLQFLLFEAISNVLQHAQARKLRIEAEAKADGGVRIRVIDDGRGFDAMAMPRAMQMRATALGARLAIESRPGRTVVGIDIA